MPTADQARIEADRARPRIVELWWALRPLTSIVRFMQTGAHPDDEISGMLAALAYRDGFNISYACSTRGEGGQNDVGQETGAALGALRTCEMEKACDVLGLRLYWHSETPSDSITDFGFSKSGDDTLRRWGRDRTLARFVDIVRIEKPDIICPTFLDVPGQHGHHRAMTEAAHDVMTAAADPAFPSNRTPWQVKKLYLPAWSGAGQAYDDDLPPPPATLTVQGTDSDPVSGWSWERIGQQSRAFHRTQGMGRWVSNGEQRDWPLHLVESHVDGPDETLSAGLARTLGDLSALPGAEDSNFAEGLTEAQTAIDSAVTAFPSFDRVAEAALRALDAIRRARIACPADLRDDTLHHLDAKEVQLGHVIRLALGVDFRCRVNDVFLAPGSDAALTLELVKGEADRAEVAFDLPKGWRLDGDRLEIDDNASPSTPYPVTYDPREPRAPAAELTITSAKTATTVRLPFECPPVVLPSPMGRVTPDAALLNLTTRRRSQNLRIDDVFPQEATVALEMPEGWSARPSGRGIEIEAPQALDAGLLGMGLNVGGQPAMNVQKITHAHCAPTSLSTPAVFRVLALNAELPDVKVGYIGAGNDRVNHWLSMLGADVTEVADSEMSDAEALQRFDTIVIGIFAMRFRVGLAEAMPALHRWTHAGGTLVTLYHRPWDNWVPDETPPFRLEIGQPSLRWRVTDEAAQVRHLSDHPLLTTPNKIGPEDWEGWVKERGLYFAKSWDDAYAPLLEMADPDEAPHQGALLVADVGAGRHVHTSLILHHQMENLVPGAFRLMANFIAKRS